LLSRQTSGRRYWRSTRQSFGVTYSLKASKIELHILSPGQVSINRWRLNRSKKPAWGAIYTHLGRKIAKIGAVFPSSRLLKVNLWGCGAGAGAAVDVAKDAARGPIVASYDGCNAA
jgi:hypothetical protein